MMFLRMARNAAVALATLGTVIPCAPLMAADGQPSGRPSVKVVDAKIFDIALTQGGTFKGRVVDHTGTALEGTEVSIKQNNKEVAHTVTDKSGTFSVASLKTGVYTVSSGATEGTYRMWDEKSAPPSAKEQGLLVLGQNGTRGNFGYVDRFGVWVVGAIAVSALIIAIIALNDHKELSMFTLMATVETEHLQIETAEHDVLGCFVVISAIARIQ